MLTLYMLMYIKNPVDSKDAYIPLTNNYIRCVWPNIQLFQISSVMSDVKTDYKYLYGITVSHRMR